MDFYHLLKPTDALHWNRNYGPKHLHRSRVIPCIQMAAPRCLCRQKDKCRSTPWNFH